MEISAYKIIYGNIQSITFRIIFHVVGFLSVDKLAILATILTSKRIYNHMQAATF